MTLQELIYDVLPDGTVNVARLSPLTGTMNTMTLPITEEQLIGFCQDGGMISIQRIFPNLSQEQREFLKTGYTPDDWVAMFGECDERDD